MTTDKETTAEDSPDNTNKSNTEDNTDDNMASGGGNNSNNNGTANNESSTVSRSGNLLQQSWGLVALVLRVVLAPLRLVSEFLFPFGDFDGLSPAVTAKAAQQFVSYLHKLNPTANLDMWTAQGFSALKSEMAQSNSLAFIYLHSPHHRQANDFCEKMFLNNNPQLQSFLQDLHCLGVSIHTAQGARLAEVLEVTSFPLIALLQPKPSNHRRSTSNVMLNLLFKAEGPALLKLQPEQLLTLITAASHHHQMALAEQEARRLVFEQETALRREQDEEYLAALEADQQREREKQEQEEEERKRLAEEEEVKRLAEEAEKNRIESAKALLKPEPTSGGTRLRFVLPTGQKLDRRFENDQPIKALKAFLILHFQEHNIPITNIALSSNFPKKTYEDDELNLEETGLSPQAVLMVQDLDA